VTTERNWTGPKYMYPLQWLPSKEEHTDEGRVLQTARVLFSRIFRVRRLTEEPVN